MKLQELLTNIDSQLETKKPSEKLLVKLMAPLAFCALSYLVLIPDSEAKYDAKMKTQSELMNKKETIQSQINNIKQTNQIPTLENEINEIQTNIELQIILQEDAENKLISLQTKQKEWQALLELVSESAKANTLTIEALETKVDESSSIDFQIISIDVSGSGNFHNVMRFINDVERFGIFVQINHIVLDMEKRLNFYIKVTSKRIKL